MTALQAVENYLLNRWDPTDLSGQRNSLPDIGTYNSSKDARIIRESSAETRKMNVDSYDALLIRDGGVTEVDPQSFGWLEERLVSRVTVDIRTSGRAGAVSGRERLWGERGTNNSAPTYGGLTGEVKRVMDEVRKGDSEFDLIRVGSMNDLSGEMGGQIWRANVEVVLDQRAASVDPNQ